MLAATGELEAQRKISPIACAYYVTNLRHNNQLYMLYIALHFTCNHENIDVIHSVMPLALNCKASIRNLIR